MENVGYTLVLVGLLGLGISGLAYGRALGRLITSLRTDHSRLWSNLGAPSGISPPGPAYGRPELRKFLSEKKYLQSDDPKIVALGTNARRWLLLSLVFFLFFVFGILGAAIH